LASALLPVEPDLTIAETGEGQPKAVAFIGRRLAIFLISAGVYIASGGLAQDRRI
jgi:hypothetical protein